MPTGLLIVVLILVLVVIALQVALLRRKVVFDWSPIDPLFASIEKSQERTERSVRDEIAKNREESARREREGREEIGGVLRAMSDALHDQLAALTRANEQKLDAMRETMERRLAAIQDDGGKRLDQSRAQTDAGVQRVRDEVAGALKNFETSVGRSLETFGGAQRMQLSRLDEQLTKLTASNEKSLETVRVSVEARLKTLQDDNAKSLEQMRQTVDEKLQGTLERRLSESFNLVSDRLEQVCKGLGEMQALATGVGDLKRVLTNVKSRGTWGEVQLAALLEQVLTPEQFETNAAVSDGGERVEFAIKLPHRGDSEDESLYLPIDAKFPVEDYQRLIDAQEKADAVGCEEACKQLEGRIRQCAKDIHSKYINPPRTTDFAILFLPTEGLFAEVLRRAGLPEAIQRDFKVVIAGPTTLWSILNSLQMGFRTLAIQKRSSEVWTVLGGVKMQFEKYRNVLEKVQRKLHDASHIIDKDMAVRTRAIERSLKAVQTLPAAEESVPRLAAAAFESADGLLDDSDD